MKNSEISSANKTIFLNTKGDTVEVNIVGTIGDSMFGDSYTREMAKNDILNNKDKNLNINLFTNGGNLYDGIFIHDILKQHPKKTTCNVIGLVASAGTIIALGCDNIRMSANATFMIHQPALMAVVTPSNVDEISSELDKAYNVILQIYQAKTGLSEEILKEMMNKQDQYFTATEALKNGFVDEVFTPMKLAASLMNDAVNGRIIEDYLKNKNLDMEIQAKYDELTNSYDTLKNEFETLKIDLATEKEVKNTLETQLNSVIEENKTIVAEKETLTVEITALKDAQIVDYIESAVTSGKIVLPMRESYLTLARANFAEVKNILSATPERVSVNDILNIVAPSEKLDSLVKGKENWDEIKFMQNDRETLEKIKNLHPQYFEKIHKIAYPKG
jgi:ATP-dependent Clp protease protease subunit